MAATVEQFLGWWTTLDFQTVWAAQPYRPRFFESLGLFPTAEARRGTLFQAEVTEDRVYFLETRQRGSAGQRTPDVKPKRAYAEIPHIPFDIRVDPSDLENLDGGVGQNAVQMRKSGAAWLAQLLRKHKEHVYTTYDWHMAKAIEGVLVDTDAGATTLHSYFDLFGVTQPTANLTNGQYLADISALKLVVQDLMGGDMFEGISVICGTTFFNTLRNDSEIITAMDPSDSVSFVSADLNYDQFSVRGVTFIHARGMKGATPFIPLTKGRVVVNGSDQFQRIDGSAYAMSQVNMPGVEVYTTTKVLDHEQGIEIKGQSNRLHVNTRPSVSIIVSLA